MKNIKRFSLSLAALLIFSGAAMSAAASAAMRPGPLPVAVDTSSSDMAADSVEVHNLTAKLRQRGEAELKTHKGQAKTPAERQKACTAHKNTLDKRMDNSVSWARRHKAVFDSIYSRLKQFHDSKNLNVADYDSLSAAADTAKANAQTSIEALKALNMDIDCSSQTVAAGISAFQQAVKDTRDSLKAYRAALVDLINSLKGASTANTDKTDSTEQ